MKLLLSTEKLQQLSTTIEEILPTFNSIQNDIKNYLQFTSEISLTLTQNQQRKTQISSAEGILDKLMEIIEKKNQLNMKMKKLDENVAKFSELSENFGNHCRNNDYYLGKATNEIIEK